MLCIYCHEREGTTDDHIIPKQFYSEPWPNDFITVPACRECNLGFEKDEEYFRIVITGSLQANSNSQAAKDIFEGPVTRSFERRPNLINTVAKDTRLFPVISDDGNQVGFVQGYYLNKDRINNVVGKIVKALFYVHKKQLLPKQYYIETNIDVKQWMIPEELMILFGTQPVREIGKGRGVFEYICLEPFKSDENRTLWLFSFYRSIYILARTNVSK